MDHLSKAAAEDEQGDGRKERPKPRSARPILSAPQLASDHRAVVRVRVATATYHLNSTVSSIRALVRYAHDAIPDGRLSRFGTLRGVLARDTVADMTYHVARAVAKAWVVVAIALCIACARGAPIAQANGTKVQVARLEAGTVPSRMYAGGAQCIGRPTLLVHAYNADFYILRQPACTNYEKPFLYLLFGSKRALLLDTGAGGLDVAASVDSIVQAWRARHGQRPLELIVAHSHAHADHVAGDSLFRAKPSVTVVGRDTAAVRVFFKIAHWPNDTATFDLGERVLDVLPIPGHQPASLAIYDRRTGILLTGDTFYPGRLYVRDTASFVRSVQRLVAFTQTHPISHLLGTHIENSDVAFRDYVVRTIDQPQEHALALTVSNLKTLDSALATMRGRIVRTVLPDFTIWP